MRIREHRSQHEVAEELPLLTESAVVTEVSAMDRNRTEETLAALQETLDDHGSEAWHAARPADAEATERLLRARLDDVDPPDDPLPLGEYLSPERREGDVGAKVAALQQRYLQPHPSLLRIVVETTDPVGFVAGQYLALRFEDTTRVYSVASSPNRDEVEFCVRRVPGGDLTTSLAVDLDVGDRVSLRGPYGELLLEEPSGRDTVFLATGTGVAPLRSMIHYLFEEGWDHYEGTERDVWLFVGAGWRDALPYFGEFASLADERANFHFVPTLSRERYLSDWQGETAYVQYVLAKYLDDDAIDPTALPESFLDARREPPRRAVGAGLDPANVEVYACGLDAMVQSLVGAVERLGVPEEHTQFEGFG